MIDWNEAVNEYIKSKERQPDKLAPSIFRCSSLSGCVRSCVKTRSGLYPHSLETLKHFEIGTILHRFLQQNVAVGHIHEPIEMEKRLEYEVDGIRLVGHADCVTADTIFDFKSTSNLQTTLSYPASRSYVYQLSAYCHGLHKQRAIVVYIDKRNLTIGQKEIGILQLDQIISFCRRVMDAESVYKETGELPPRCNECFQCRREKRDEDLRRNKG